MHEPAPRFLATRSRAFMNAKKLEELKAEVEPLTKLMKEVLGDKTEKVAVSRRKADSPCVLTTSEYGWLYDLLHGIEEDNGNQSKTFNHD